jgi:hypothetical protein
MDNQNSLLISWSFPEFSVPERSKTWYILAFVIGGALLLYSILTANFLFGLIIILAAVIMGIQQHKEAGQVNFGIAEDGVLVGDKFFAYQDIKRFWLVYEPPRIKNLYLEFNSMLRPRLTIPLEDTNPIKVRKILLEHISEDLSKESEPTSEALGRILKI